MIPLLVVGLGCSLLPISTVATLPVPTVTAEATRTVTEVTRSPEGTEAARPNIERVVVFSLDGMRPDALTQEAAPRLNALAASGAVDWYAQTILPSVTLPAHLSMLSGLDVSEHGYLINDNPPVCEPVLTPTFLLMAQNAGWQTGMAVGKEKFCIFRQSLDTAYRFGRSGDASVADYALELLDSGVEVLFVHFPNPDYFGHGYGWMSEQYLWQIDETDEQVGRVLDALDANTMVIVSADHGGHDITHGTDMPEDRTIPWIIAGPGIAPGQTLEHVSVADTAQTVLWALNLPLPASTLGRPRLEAFGLPLPDPALTPEPAS